MAHFFPVSGCRCRSRPLQSDLQHSPLTYAQIMSSPNSSQASTPPSSAWILVVDDDQPIRRMFQDVLEETGLTVVVAAGADEALAIVGQRTAEPLVAFIDVLMPGTDGLTLARKLRALFKRGLIVIMSGHLSDVSWWPEDLRDVDFMAKPFRRDEVVERVETARRSQES